MQVDEARLLSCVLQLALIQRLQFRMKCVFFRVTGTKASTFIVFVSYINETFSLCI